MYKRMENEARQLLADTGYDEILNLEAQGRTLSNYIQEQRQKPEFYNPVSEFLEVSLLKLSVTLYFLPKQSSSVVLHHVTCD